MSLQIRSECNQDLRSSKLKGSKPRLPTIPTKTKILLKAALLKELENELITTFFYFILVELKNYYIKNCINV
jgi:hypothetical protein